MDLNQERKIIITHALFCGEYIARELSDKKYPILSENRLFIESRGNLKDCIVLNLYLRNAHRVLLLLKWFDAASLDDLYNNVSKIPWEEIIPLDGYFSIHSSVNQKNIKDFRIVNLKVKDAIADRFMKKYGKRPDSGNQSDKLVLFIHWKDNRAEIYLDTSGESISRHGYRKHSWKAPLAEALASSIIDSTVWDHDSPLINPMCGSGTIAIEAAMKATNRFPGLYRDNYSFLHISNNPYDQYAEIKKNLENQIMRKEGLKIFASDIHRNAVNQARLNAEIAGVSKHIRFETADFRKISPPTEAGVIIMNPEYGSRLGEEVKLRSVYQEIGNFFKKKCQGYTGYIFSGNTNLSKQVGLRTRRKVPFMNGTIECRLLEYELYGGSRKNSREKKEQ